ncbi:MAG TPA: SDR family oxidoreductase [Acidobacteriaceae bacterium]|nr:SDR family oxidoreductase [Acidobacteriaceae bacterium]
MKLTGKVAIVTGAASGIGRASAIAFAREGAKVVVADCNEAGGKETVAEILSAGAAAHFAHVDVAKEDDIREMVDATVARWGTIDILFNNAGVVLVKSVEQMTEEEWDRVMSINVKAAFLATKHVVPVMRRNGGGAILNTGSIASFTGQLGTPAYSASKGAIALLTKSLALDVGRDRIRVNCICPGITDTPMLREHLGQGDEGEARIRSRLARVPLGEILHPEDVARAALYLVSEDSAGITGVLHVVDGGLLAASEFDQPI